MVGEMIINIKEGERLRGTDDCWQLERRVWLDPKKVKKRPETAEIRPSDGYIAKWKPYKYWTKLQAAGKYLAERYVRTADDFTAAQKQIRDLQDNITQCLEGKQHD